MRGELEFVAWRGGSGCEGADERRIHLDFLPPEKGLFEVKGGRNGK